MEWTPDKVKENVRFGGKPEGRVKMRLAYIFITPLSHRILSTMILPQLESGRHGAEIIGMMFFVDNTYFLTKDDELAKRLQKIHENTGMLLMACDQCAYERNIDKKLVHGARIGCFPDLYKGLGDAGGVDQVITF